MAADIYADQIPLLLQHLRLRPFVGHRQRRLPRRGPIAGRSEERVLARQLVSLDALRVLNGGVERGDMLSAVSFQFIQCANARQAFERLLVDNAQVEILDELVECTGRTVFLAWGDDRSEERRV